MNNNIEKADKSNTVRIILNVPQDLDEKFRDLAKKRGISKSSMVMFAMSWYLDYCNSIDLTPQLLEAFKLLSEDKQKK